jgi:RNA polymerase sigma-70 factor (ECF subfamily)
MNEHDERIQTELLVIRCQQGEKEAFESLVKLWQKPLLRFALRYLDLEADAGDVVQETWLSVIEGLRTLQNPSMFVSWMFRILTNKCIDHIRAKKTQRDRLKQTTDQEQGLHHSNENDSLSLALQKLSDEQRMLITLRFEHEMQIGQIAAMLNIAEGTVKSKLHRALARLREIIGDKI